MKYLLRVAIVLHLLFSTHVTIIFEISIFLLNPAIMSNCSQFRTCNAALAVCQTVCIESTERTEMEACPALTSCENVTLCHADTDCEDDSFCCLSDQCGPVCTGMKQEDRPPSSEYHCSVTWWVSAPRRCGRSCSAAHVSGVFGALIPRNEVRKSRHSSY
jgi:hypothetical protein